MKVVRFLERKEVIRFFGIALILAPFLNFAMHTIVIKMQSGVAWSQFQYWSVLKTTHLVSFLLAICSVTIGTLMLTGAKAAWKWVLVLIGSHLAVQILNIGDKAWTGPLAWPSFLFNAGLFFFIMDQLVWKVNAAPAQSIATTVPVELQRLPAAVVNLKSYRKILFSFGSTKPWGELKTLSSEMLTVKCIAPPPDNIGAKTVEINFSKDVVVEIQFHKCEADLYFFRPLNMDKEKVTKLNKWLRKIAV